MIKQSTIDELRNKMDLHDVLSRFIVIKKNMACCPFHGEKTPSFHLWQKNQTYKCFGCGKSGDAITFVMEHERKTFIEAVEYLCNLYNIAIEEDHVSKQEAQDKKDKRQEMLQLVSFAHKKYEDALHNLPADAPAIQYLQSRGYDDERIKRWSLGFAPDDWKFITTPIINMGKHGTALECGLLSSKEGKNWDFYRNRIIIPIHDHNGILVGIAGRIVPGAEEQQAKYFNPCESLIYHKKKLWYGLWQAQKAIKEQDFAYVCEGYMDVQAMHDAGLYNAIAACGTEIDANQVKLLKRYTSHAVLCFDGDKAGIEKMLKLVDLFLKEDMKVSVVDLPDAKDPDEYIQILSLNKTPENATID